jgi:hypothetical protein
MVTLYLTIRVILLPKFSLGNNDDVLASSVSITCAEASQLRTAAMCTALKKFFIGRFPRSACWLRVVGAFSASAFLPLTEAQNAIKSAHQLQNLFARDAPEVLRGHPRSLAKETGAHCPRLSLNVQYSWIVRVG